MLYRWSSECLRDCGNGQIIVWSDSIANARKIARAQFELWVRERFSYLFFEGDYLNSDCERDVQDCRDIFEQDISLEPQLVESGCLFIQGSG